MLSRENTELLCHVGAGTVMGDMMRQYWLPCVYSWELTPDGDPVRVRMLGEDLIAWRDSNGTPSFVANNCPHRGASLFFGRNEEAGLRCVYHGWKFDTSGACIDMPNHHFGMASEPAESDFNAKVKATAYPTQERGGIVWAYLGPEPDPPRAPELEFTHVPDSHRLVTKRIQYCNFLQNVEGEVDSSHVSFLHSKGGGAAASAGIQDLRSTLPEHMGRDRSPRVFVVPTEDGLVIGARRDAASDRYYSRITQVLSPSLTMITLPIAVP